MTEPLNERKILARLTAEELDHLKLGLLNAWGADLQATAGNSLFILETEDGNRIALDALTLDVRDAWQTAEASAA